jgi:hypothetical protein
MACPVLESRGSRARSGTMFSLKRIGCLFFATSALLTAAPEEGFEPIFDGT